MIGSSWSGSPTTTAIFERSKAPNALVKFACPASSIKSMPISPFKRSLKVLLNEAKVELTTGVSKKSPLMISRLCFASKPFFSAIFSSLKITLRARKFVLTASLQANIAALCKFNASLKSSILALKSFVL